MKKLLTKFLAISGIALLMLASCKKNDTMTKMNANSATTLSASSTTITLDRTKLADSSTIATFNFTKPNYGFSASVTYILQVDSAGDNWVNPQSVTIGSGKLVQRFNTSDLNSLLLKIVPGGVTSSVNVRIEQSLSTTEKIYSNVLSLKVTPFLLAQYIYVAGAYEGWAVPSANLASLVSPTANKVYTGLVNFTPGNLDFKILPENADYNGNYGAGTTAGTITQGNGNPPNITAPAPAYYMLTVDLNKNTITYLGQWSVIGDATPGGWGADTNMNIDPATGKYYTTVLLVSDGTKAIKFRFLNDWSVNLGGSGSLTQTGGNGTLTQGGGNITIPSTGAAGITYKITLDPVGNTFSLVKQ